MPNPDTILRPMLIIGAGRTASSYVQNRLRHGHGDFHAVIENDVYRDLYRDLAEPPWRNRYQWVAPEPEVRDRIVRSIRAVFCTLFADTGPGWTMKCLWSRHEPELLDTLFPEARYLHLVRDPRTNVPSMMERLGHDAERACDIYVRSNANALEFARFGARYLRVRQEDFLDRREDTWQRICAFLGCEYRPGVWEAEINTSASTSGRVATARAHDRWEWSRLPDTVQAMAAQLGYQA